jgi:hypothetical protein
MISEHVNWQTFTQATLALPFVAPEARRSIGNRFAAFHNNPPAGTFSMLLPKYA